MSVLLVTFDLQKPGQDYRGFYGTIKTLFGQSFLGPLMQ